MRKLKFVDLFAGCGGLSLGLLEAGFEGVFAVEKSPLAFETLRHNLVDGQRHNFNWPGWLPKEAMTCEELVSKYGAELDAMRGTVDVVVGGPPCQGFSTAGRRDPSDPRNQMTEQYLALVDKLQPRYLVIENVAGYNMPFESEDGFEELVKDPEHETYADYVAGILSEDYFPSRGLVNCAAFGVPQNRWRYLVICERKKEGVPPGVSGPNLLEKLHQSREHFLEAQGLPKREITAKEAIEDLAIADRKLVDNQDSGIKGFKEAPYSVPLNQSRYVSLMRRGMQGQAPNSRRLPNHRPETIEYFRKVKDTCQPGRCMSDAERNELGRKKHSTTLLHPDLPAPTVTTLPDDILHYEEPRILTVRENARLQSFPDWFEFQGKYTTGGKKRKLECPRYTQVGNAVPPLLAKAIGAMITAYHWSSISSAADEALEKSAATHANQTIQEICRLVSSNLRRGPLAPRCRDNSGGRKWGAK